MILFIYFYSEKSINDVQRLYCAEQIVVPVDLPMILKKWTKEVIRKNPENIIEFSREYITIKLSFYSYFGELVGKSSQEQE